MEWDKAFACHVLEVIRNGVLLLRVTEDDEEEALNQTFQCAHDFFALPLEQKMTRISRDSAKRGYSAQRTENFGSLSAHASPNDVVEKFRVGPPVAPALARLDQRTTRAVAPALAGLDRRTTRAVMKHFYPNDWSGAAGLLQGPCLRQYARMESVALTLAALLEAALSLVPSFLSSRMQPEHSSIMTLNYYPCSRGDEMLMAAHTDVSLFTLLQQSRGGALEVLCGGEWLAVPDVKGALVVSVGDCLEHWSRGRLTATRHRVRGADQERVSVAFFATPHPDALLEPMLGDVGQPVSYAKWRTQRVKEATALLKLLQQSETQ